MIHEVEKSPKISLCRTCRGTGKIKTCVCPQCEGSGRGTVSAKMTLDIRPYKPKVEPSMND